MSRLVVIFVSILLVTGLLVAVIFQPSENSGDYWRTAGWILFLLGLNVAVAFGPLNKLSGQNGAPGSLFGSLPAISIAVLTYSVLSVALLLAANFSLIPQSLHWGSQVLVLGLSAALVVLILIVTRTARNPARSKVSQAELIGIVSSLRRQAAGGSDASAIDELHSLVAYQLPHPSKLNQDELELAKRTLSDSDSEIEERVQKAMEALKRA